MSTGVRSTNPIHKKLWWRIEKKRQKGEIQKGKRQKKKGKKKKKKKMNIFFSRVHQAMR
jgi:hypothetical protein